MREITFQKALDEAVAEEMRRDPRVITLGTDFTGDPVKEFGPARVRFTPISESVVTGIGLGAAGSGFRPIVNWRMVTFSFVAMDQVVNQASKIRYMFGGQADFPVTYRCTTGGGIGLAAQHSQSPYSMWMHLAGLKIILPSTPADAKGLLKSAIRDNNPVVSFECSRLAAMTGPVPDGDHLVPIGVADVKRAGTDVTIVGLAYYVHEALAVARGPGARGHLRRGDRPAHAGAAGRRDDPRLGAQDRPPGHRRRGARHVLGGVRDLGAARRGPRDLPRPEGARSAASARLPCPCPTAPRSSRPRCRTESHIKSAVHETLKEASLR